MRVFLDTNVLFSAFATRGLSADVLELVTLEHDLVAGEICLRELHAVMHRKLRLPVEACDEIVDAITTEAARLVSDSVAADCDAEPEDRRILGEALAGEAEIFVTGDAALVSLRRVGGMQILTPRQFWEMLRRTNE